MTIFTYCDHCQWVQIHLTATVGYVHTERMHIDDTYLHYDNFSPLAAFFEFVLTESIGKSEKSI